MSIARGRCFDRESRAQTAQGKQLQRAARGFGRDRASTAKMLGSLAFDRGAAGVVRDLTFRSQCAPATELEQLHTTSGVAFFVVPPQSSGHSTEGMWGSDYAVDPSLQRASELTFRRRARRLHRKI